jgi:hypothetical protein
MVHCNPLGSRHSGYPPLSVNGLLSAHVIPSLAGLHATWGNAMGPSALTQTSALALLQAARPPAGKRNVLAVLRSDVFSASSARIHTALVDTFSGSKSLRETHTATFDATFDRLKKYVTMQAGVEGANTPEQSATTLRNAAHNALVDVIMTNRGSFPPEGFTIRTEYPGGAWGETEIPPGRTTPPGYQTTVQTLDKFFAEQAATETDPADNAAASWHAAQIVTSAAVFAINDAAIELLETALQVNDEAARKRAEQQYHA